MSGTAADALGLTQGVWSDPFIAGRPAPDDGTVHEQHRSGRPEPSSSSVRFRPPIPQFRQALAAWAQSIDGYGHQFLTSNCHHPAGRIERSDHRSGRDVQSGGRERAHAGAGGDLYKFRRRNRRFAGHHRPCRALIVWRARARRRWPSLDFTSRRRARASRRRTIPAFTRRTQARPRSSWLQAPVISGTKGGSPRLPGSPTRRFLTPRSPIQTNALQTVFRSRSRAEAARCLTA